MTIHENTSENSFSRSATHVVKNRLINRYLREHWVVMGSTLIFSSLNAWIAMRLLGHTNMVAVDGLNQGGTQKLIVALGWLIALIVVGIFLQKIQVMLGTTIASQLRNDLSRRFLMLDYMQLSGRKHAVNGVLIQDIAQIQMLLELAPAFVYNTLIAVLCSAYMLGISIILFAVFGCMMSASLLASVYLSRRTQALFEKARKAEESLFEHFRAIAEGKKELSLSRARLSHFLAKLLAPTIETSRQLHYDGAILWGIFGVWSNAFLYCALFAVIYCAHALISLPLATLTQFVIAGFFIVGPLQFLAGIGQRIASGVASLHHIENIGLDLEEPLAQFDKAPISVRPAFAWNLLSVKALGYQFKSEKDEGFTLGPIDIDIRRGEMIFIAGGNGSGKSTLLLLLCGLLVPSCGEIFLDGQPIDSGSTSYRDLFCGVFFDFFLFTDLVDPSAMQIPDHLAAALLDKVGLAGKVTVTEGAFSTLNLSQGQRKRLALAQCYAEDRDIFFFDEWAADQDVESRERFYNVLLPELKQRGKTLIVITHDDRYFPVADRVVKLEGGRIVRAD